MSGVEPHLGLYVWEDPVRDAAWRRGAFGVSGGGRGTPLIVSGVYAEIGVSLAADLLRRGKGCEPVLWYGLPGRG